MGVGKSIEQRLEGLVEGFFTKVFRSGLQPVEVGRRILREMAEGKTLSVNRVYAPNEFLVVMGPEDHARFDQMAAGLQREFTELVIEQAKQNRWNLMGVPRFTFEATDQMGRGEFRVEASLSADPDVPGPRVSTRDRDPAEMSEARVAPSDTASRMGLAASGAELVVMEDGKEKERISVTKAPVIIGRLASSDVVLSDSNVSRRHAELRKADKGWVLVDLGSTNGTVVNGNLAREHPLKDGDRLTFGTTELVFKLRAD
ncbi:MAG TPA: DUF3662 and FHA domain-containing protein [Actinomycetota bacterium]|nr:DUF3662 and FHA domain-containing protein [Actinomycetota bacterium]